MIWTSVDCIAFALYLRMYYIEMERLTDLAIEANKKDFMEKKDYPFVKELYEVAKRIFDPIRKEKESKYG